VIDPTRFLELAAGIHSEIDLEGATRLLAYLDAMLAENGRVNLTAVREREAAVLFHALDAAAIGCGGFDAAPTRVLDLGTGNGFPGVAVACFYPWAKITLMDRTLKKLKAIERAVEACDFRPGTFSYPQMDAAEAPARGYKSKFDLVTTRAVGPPAVIGPLAKPLLERGGRLLCWLSDDMEDPSQLKGGMKRLGGVNYYLPAPADRSRRLVHYGRPG
jgi:16S rRNA (guanine527-N7)-methyltransferase